MVPNLRCLQVEIVPDQNDIVILATTVAIDIMHPKMKKPIFLIVGLSELVMLLAACSTATDGLVAVSWKLVSFIDANGDIEMHKLDQVSD